MSTSSRVASGRPATDRIARHILRVGNAVDPTAILGARRSTTAALVVSGIRCTITYLLIPIVAPFVGLVAAVGTPVSLILSLLAVVMAVAAVRRFWIADHRSRWAYTAFIVVVLVALSVAVVMDVATLIG